MAGYEVSRSSTGVVEEDKQFDLIYKLLVIGDSNVGKTTLLTRFCEDRYHSNFMSTVGIDYKTKIIKLENERIKLQIWDTAGQERFRTLTNAYFRGAAGALLLYDITNRSSFSNCSNWMESVAQHASPSICVIIVGHKSDAEEERAVTTVEGQRLAEHYNANFFEASAKSGQNVTKVFMRLAEIIKLTQEKTSHQQTNKTTINDKNLRYSSSQINDSRCSC